MISVDEITNEILHREGGYVNDPDDLGGATNHGVTIHTMRRLGLDLTGDGRVTTVDVKALSYEQAADIYTKHYFYKPKINQLPDVLKASVFDMMVNSGSNAIKILQSMLNDFGEDVAVDGALGPHSLAAAHRVWQKAPEYISDAYGIERRNYYYRLADKRSRLRKFARRRDGGKGGWITRAEEFIHPRFHLSHKQHMERTATWV